MISAAAATLALGACGDLPNNGNGGGGYADRGPMPSNGGDRSAGQVGMATGIVGTSGSNAGTTTGTGAGTMGGTAAGSRLGPPTQGAPTVAPTGTAGAQPVVRRQANAPAGSTTKAP
jgi:hypothetical protein